MLYPVKVSPAEACEISKLFIYKIRSRGPSVARSYAAL